MSMSSKEVSERLAKALLGPVMEILGEIEVEAQERAVSRVTEALGKSFGDKPINKPASKKAAAKTAVKKRGRKRRYFKRPCPVPKCKSEAFPRYHQVCKEHCEEMEVEDIDALRAKAERPGGIWYKLGIGKYAQTDIRNGKLKDPAKAAG